MSALDWLDPLRTSLPELDGSAWLTLRHLNSDLATMSRAAPAASDDPTRSQWLADLRTELASRGHHAPPGPAGLLWQTAAQFIAGFHDLDLRDCTGPGHGAMILTDGTPPTAGQWRRRLDRGELVGIAATERHGGSRIREISTRATLHPDGRWRITGDKCWVSRLVEAAGFVVFFRDPDERISAGIIDASDPRLQRDVVDPFGLGGWSWGILHLHQVPLDPATALIGTPGGGLTVFDRHFAQFRPLVTATALGTAAGVHRFVVDTLAARTRSGDLPRVRDNALIAVGRTHAEITAALLSAFTTTRLAAAGHPRAGFTARIGKAAGVDTAHRAVTDLAPLLGAAGFQRHHPVAKARADLTGLLYADGIHDSLYRSGGTDLLTTPRQATTAILPIKLDAAA